MSHGARTSRHFASGMMSNRRCGRERGKAADDGGHHGLQPVSHARQIRRGDRGGAVWTVGLPHGLTGEDAFSFTSRRIIVYIRSTNGLRPELEVAINIVII